MSAQSLPVSRELVTLRDPDGHDEMLLTRQDLSGLDLYVAVLNRLAPPTDSARVWNDLPYADIGPAFLMIRRRRIADRIIAEVTCEACGGKGDLTFSTGVYLEAHAPSAPRGVTRAPDGWWHLGTARFRPPRVCDIRTSLTAAPTPSGQALALENMSIEANTMAERQAARRALARVAPMVEDEVVGACPDCRSRINAWFDPASFVLAELAQAAAAVVDDVHLIASQYGWPEAAILDLPGWRRARYAALIGGAAPGALATAARSS